MLFLTINTADLSVRKFCYSSPQDSILTVKFNFFNILKNNTASFLMKFNLTQEISSDILHQLDSDHFGIRASNMEADIPSTRLSRFNINVRKLF